MLMRMASRFIADEHGATAIEYGLIAALIAVAILSSLAAFSDSLSALFGTGVGGAAGHIGNASNSIR